MTLLLRGCAVLALGCLVERSHSAATNPIVSDVVGNGAGRAFQASDLNGPVPKGAASGLKHAYNWSTVREGPTTSLSWQFYEGAIDSQGDIYYFGFGRGQTPPCLYKIAGSTAGNESGTLLWRVALPVPFWQDGTAGNDHLFLTPSGLGPNKQGLAIAIPGVSWYNLPYEGYIAAIDLAGGYVAWLHNTTVQPQNARLSADGKTLFIHWWNHSVSVIDTETGDYAATYDFSSILVNNKTAYWMTVAEGVPAKPADDSKPTPTAAPVALFSVVGFAAAFDLGSGEALWSGPDPTGDTSFGPAWGAGHVRGSADAVFSTSGNYLDVMGIASVDVISGDVSWGYNWSTYFIQATRYPTRQGTIWVRNGDSSGYDSARLLTANNGSLLGQAYLPHPPYSGLNFQSAMVTSGDGQCQYHVAEGTSCDTCQSDVYLIGYCAISPTPSASPYPTRSTTPTASASATNGATSGSEFGATTDDAVPASPVRGNPSIYANVYNVMINELCHPDIRKIAIGPAEGQLTVWHTRGVVVYEATDDPPPPDRRGKLCRN